MVYDVVIVGGGLGGLVCASILSKHGLSVLVLEKHQQMGGCLQTFVRHGVKFDTGMHYVGSMDEGQALYRLFGYMGIADGIPLSRLDPHAYDIIVLEGEHYPYASGYDRFAHTLAQRFPQQADQLGEYVRRVRSIAQASPLYDLRLVGSPSFMEAPCHRISIDHFVAGITSNPALQAVLLGNMPLYDGVHGLTPAYIHAIISNSYMQSAFRVVGGSDTIARALCRSIERQGGCLRTGAEVAELLCDDQRMTAVRLDSGELLMGRRFISTMHPWALMGRIGSPLLRRAYRERIAAVPNSLSNFTLYLRFKPNSVPYLNSNLFYYHDRDAWASAYSPERFGRRFMFMHQCHQPNPSFAQSAVLIAPMAFAEVARWAHGRGEAGYRELKQQRAELLIDRLNCIFPGISAKIEGYHTSTPLTYERYTSTAQGATYGLMRDAGAPERSYISHRTKIPNLLLAGQSITAHGALGVTMGAVVVCADILGPQLLEQIERWR